MFLLDYFSLKINRKFETSVTQSVSRLSESQAGSYEQRIGIWANGMTPDVALETSTAVRKSPANYMPRYTPAESRSERCSGATLL